MKQEGTGIMQLFIEVVQVLIWSGVVLLMGMNLPSLVAALTSKD
jgi:hypothetical protein